MTKQLYQLKKNSTLLANYMFEKAVNEIQESQLKNISLIVELLRQSSCLGHHDSSFMLYAIYSFGIGLKKDTKLVKISFYIFDLLIGPFLY